MGKNLVLFHKVTALSRACRETILPPQVHSPCPFPVLWAPGEVLSQSYTFIFWLFVMEMPNATAVCQAHPTSVLA